MITKPLKYMIMALIAIVFILVCIYAYRVLFMFNKAKIKALVTTAANNYSAPDAAYKMITESVESILKSADLTAQVKQLASINKTDNETALVTTALNQCYALGFLGRVNASINGENAAPVTEASAAA